MPELATTAAGLALGLSMSRIVMLLLAIRYPVPLGILIVFHVWRNRRPISTRPLTFCEAVADELRSGSSLRSALRHAALSVEAGSLAARAEDAPMGTVAAAAAREFPDVGPELEVCIERSAWSGAPIADLFDELAGMALAQVDLRHEVRTALAPARATVMVLGVAPIVAVWLTLANGDQEVFLTSTAQRLSVVIGLVLIATSIAVGALLVRRSK